MEVKVMANTTALREVVSAVGDNSYKYEQCLLFIPNVGMSGGVKYRTKDHKERESADEKEIKEWNTERTVDNREEFDKARALKEKFRRRFNKLGSVIKSGVIIRVDKRDDLTRAIVDTEDDIRVFNRTSSYSRFWFYPVSIMIDSSNSNVMIACARQLLDLLTQIQRQLKVGDYKKVRKLLKGVSVDNYSDLFKGENSVKIQEAFDNVKESTRQLAKQARDLAKGIDATQKEIDLAPIDVARACFVELLPEKGKDSTDDDIVPYVDTRSSALIEPQSSFM
jgi:hypothetical protein